MDLQHLPDGGSPARVDVGHVPIPIPALKASVPVMQQIAQACLSSLDQVKRAEALSFGAPGQSVGKVLNTLQAELAEKQQLIDQMQQQATQNPALGGNAEFATALREAHHHLAALKAKQAQLTELQAKGLEPFVALKKEVNDLLHKAHTEPDQGGQHLYQAQKKLREFALNHDSPFVQEKEMLEARVARQMCHVEIGSNTLAEAKRFVELLQLPEGEGGTKAAEREQLTSRLKDPTSKETQLVVYVFSALMARGGVWADLKPLEQNMAQTLGQALVDAEVLEKPSEAQLPYDQAIVKEMTTKIGGDLNANKEFKQIFEKLFKNTRSPFTRVEVSEQMEKAYQVKLTLMEWWRGGREFGRCTELAEEMNRVAHRVLQLRGAIVLAARSAAAEGSAMVDKYDGFEQLQQERAKLEERLNWLEQNVADISSRKDAHTAQKLAQQAALLRVQLRDLNQEKEVMKTEFTGNTKAAIALTNEIMKLAKPPWFGGLLTTKATFAEKAAQIDQKLERLKAKEQHKHLSPAEKQIIQAERERAEALVKEFKRKYIERQA